MPPLEATSYGVRILKPSQRLSVNATIIYTVRRFVMGDLCTPIYIG
jgi:hypothetical protein